MNNETLDTLLKKDERTGRNKERSWSLPAPRCPAPEEQPQPVGERSRRETGASRRGPLGGPGRKGGRLGHAREPARGVRRGEGRREVVNPYREVGSVKPATNKAGVEVGCDLKRS